ncbi:hypothetical protein AAG570_010639 [Ranatra chinensis]|uniref:lysozyme n=1 Tax=Ranatra chinensis TaxID=642074 RepID=A0ABD0YZ40_9HEMI
MEMKAALGLSVLIAVTVATSAEIYGMCQLAKELIKDGVPMKDVPDWLCLAKAVSQMDTSRTTGPAKDGSYSYGIFQIPSNEWCTKGKQGNKCNVKCEDLVAGSLLPSVQCSQLIYSQKGFQFWDGWVKSCKDKPLPDIHGC